MRTCAVRRENQSVASFEISSLHSTTTIARVLKSVPGVENVRRQWFTDVRLTFTYQGVPSCAFEPFGDSDRVSIGPRAPSDLDWSSVLRAFDKSWGGWLLGPAVAAVAIFVAWTKWA
jgi:hypothetical protein